MPIHDWTRIPAGLFHDFHQTWSIQLKIALNSGILPKGLAALVEQRAGTKVLDVLAIESRSGARRRQDDNSSGLLTLERPTATITYRTTNEIYAGRANRIVIKHHLGRTVAVIEILSPGNKDSRAAVRDFVDKTIDFLRAGIHVLIVDLFPPSPRDPLGMHKLIWDEISDEPFAFPPGKDRILASYETGPEKSAFVEPIAVGDAMPDMPLFVTEGIHIKVPLEPTYQSAWQACPEALQEAVVTGVIPEPDAEEA
ncbi:MAG: DUF4058 family protein [Gemmataceae bacterium]|nr:DUF4058 family protein [Gemmataceae bacterium]